MLKKRAVSLIFALLMLQCAAPGYAAKGGTSATVSVASAYYKNGFVYCCVKSGNAETDISSISVGVTSNDGSNGEMRNPKAVKDGDRSVNYMLLVDTSTSMEEYRVQLAAFVDALLRAEHQSVQITVASFGKTFTIVEEGLSEAEQVRQTLDHLSYTQQISDIGGGVADALAYLSEHTEAGGAIYNLVVLTDGEVYLEGTDIRKAANEAAQAIEQISEVIVHTVGFGTWETATLKALSSGTGVDCSIRSRNGAVSAGNSVAQFVDSLYYMDLPFKAGKNTEFMEAQLMLSIPTSEELEFVPIKSLRNLDYINIPALDVPSEDSSGFPARPEDGSESILGDDSAGDTSADPDKEDSGDKTLELPGGSSGGDGNEAASSDITDAAEPPSLPWLPITVGAAVIVLVSAAVGVSKVSDRTKRRTSAADSKDGIRMRLELLSENISSTRFDCLLVDELIIGSDNSCDIVFTDETVTGWNSRIYLKDGFVYIEDMNSRSNTCIGGMRIHAPNRLRSGNEIMVGRVRFRVEF